MPSIDISAGTIHYEASGPESGRPVVFVHGFMMSGQLWRQVSQRLAGAGLRCIAPTWPLGAHPEALRPGADQAIAGVAHIVADFLAALDLEDVVLVGNDTGGLNSRLLIDACKPWSARTGTFRVAEHSASEKARACELWRRLVGRPLA